MTSLDQSSKARTYSSHLANTLLPALELVQQHLVQIDDDIREYEELAGRIEQLERSEKAQFTLVEVGAGVWADAYIPDTSVITLDLGLDLHFDLPLADAREYSGKRLDVLRKRRAAIKAKEDSIRWQIEQFEGALGEIGHSSLAIASP